ncbi:hypothetical protein GGH92_010727, partial [Coemansia sp. RSA 2673]
AAKADFRELPEAAARAAEPGQDDGGLDRACGAGVGDGPRGDALHALVPAADGHDGGEARRVPVAGAELHAGRRGGDGAGPVLGEPAAAVGAGRVVVPTVLLRSNEVLSRAASELVNLIEPEAHVSHVYTTLGTEQEFFLVDRTMYALRPDLKITGRTLVGQLPPRHQQLEDHYFGRIPSRVMRVISELELECLKLGIPIKTRHNEVAPGQFEVAPIFEEASAAVDHNLLTMDVLHKVAHRHNLRVLYHEKPFKGINGSGKHCNWSMSTSRGENL